MFMCGIFGIITEKFVVPVEVIKNGVSYISHRGPDDQGIFQQGPVAFGHCRLSVIDLATGHQPMQNAEKSLCITYNGEIYNHRELRKELAAKGHVFHTQSDTETLLAAYSEWGAACVERLRGMYAFALADFSRRQIFLARDIFGIKPLVYRQGAGVFAFASEIPALLRIPFFPQSPIDKEAVALFFRYQYIPSPHSVYSDIRKLQPAHAMLVGFDGQIQRIWRHHSFSFSPDKKLSETEALEQTDAVIQEAVLAHTLSDVPIGVFLSGGIDSTLIAFNLARTVGKEIPAFTIIFNEEEFSELTYAEIAAKRLGLTLHVATVDAECMEKLPGILAHYGEPYGDSSVLPTWHVTQFARKFVPVVLSGDGGDELFGGYHSHAAWMRHSTWRNIKNLGGAAARLRPQTCYRHLRELLAGKPNSKEAWQSFVQYYTPEGIRILLKPEYRMYADSLPQAYHELDDASAVRSRLDKAQLYDMISYMPECILPKVDVTSMCHGLEVRPALLDKKVLSFACSLPERYRFNSNQGGKAVLKRLLLHEGFSENFVYRYKQGFSSPIKHWLLPGGKAREMLEEYLLDAGDTLSEYLELAEVKRILHTHSEQMNMASHLWLILAFLCWMREQ